MDDNYLKKCKQYKKFNYLDIPSDELDYLHRTDLKMLSAIKEVFEKHKIKYCAVGGTLLGAFTTGRYIPWDEDIDIAVFEEDYERMIHALINELPEWMEVLCDYTEEKYYHEWIKVSDKNSTIYPNNGLYKHQGCWVDIYKLRKMNKSEVKLNIALAHKDYLLRRLKVKDIDEKEFNKRIKENKLEETISEQKEVLKHKLQNDEPVYLVGTASKPYVELKYVFPLKNYAFENTSITSFNDANAYLTNHYGSTFNQLPPPEDRTIAINKVEYK